MKQATFYLMEHHQPDGELDAVEALACDLAAQHWRFGKRILLACQSQEQAQKLDEALWARDPHQFVPHNLAGEGPHYGAPVELSWPGKRGNSPRELMICLQTEFADFATAFHEVIDFVPYEDALKQLARERYKIYRSVGFQLTTATPPTH